MTIEIFEELTPTLNLDSKRARTYQRSFLVEVTGGDVVGPKTVALELGIDVGDTYVFADEEDAGAYCTGISVSAGQDRYQYKITVDYGPDEPIQENPLDTPVNVSWADAPYEERVDITAEEDPDDRQYVLNTALVPFDPPVMRDSARDVLVLVRNELNYSAALAAAFRNKVNGTEYIAGDITSPVGTAKISKITATRQTSQYLLDNLISPFGIYWTVTYDIHFDPNGWQAHILSAGRVQLSLDGTRHEQVLISGVPTTDPVPLTAAGRRVQPGYEDDPDEGVVFQDFVRYTPIDFESALNF